jgi:hypothetical protein
MARNFKLITEDELINKLKDKVSVYLKQEENEDKEYDLDDKEQFDRALNSYLRYEHNSFVGKDIEKVDFDFENAYVSDEDYDFCGFHTLPNGMPYLGVVAGGDWETPVFFIIYWDGKKLRGYIPKEGNVYNQFTMTAYGSEDHNPKIKDLKLQEKIIKFAESIIKDSNYSRNLVKDWTGLSSYEGFAEASCDLGENFDFDWNLLEKDIMKRITIK